MNAEPLARLSGYSTCLTDPYYLVYRRLFADLEEAARMASGVLLDIGCGNKPYEKMFLGKISKYIGCDVVQSSGLRVDLICPAHQIPLPSSSVDTILCTQVIEHVPDHRALLAEAYRLLKPGGRLILTGPMYWHIHEAPYDFFRFTEFGFRWLLEEGGFCSINIKPNGGKWALLGQVIIHCLLGKRIFERLFLKLVNRGFAFLDDRYPDTKNPLNYIVTAQK